MIFAQESLTFSILDVMELEQSNVNMVNRGRPFSALSFRLSADTVLACGGEEHRLRSGAVSFVPAGVDYRRISKTDRVIVVHFDLADYRTGRIECFTPEEPDRIEGLFRRLLAAWEGREPGYRHEATALLHEIFRECYLAIAPEGGASSRIGRAVDYIHRHYTDPHLTVSAAAERSYMSEVYFRKLFRKEFGESPRKYIVGLRLRHAADLIVMGYHTLPEVAYRSGYTDYKYFSVEFKRLMGVSPSEYAAAHEAKQKTAP